MKSKFKHMQIQALDSHLSQMSVIERPSQGWIRTLRTSLGMTLAQLGGRIGISQQAAAKLEQHEMDDAITLKSLQKAAEALNCRLVYSFVPHEGSLENMISQQALKKARAIIDPVDHSMMLEAQQVEGKDQRVMVLANELASQLKSELWES